MKIPQRLRMRDEKGRLSYPRPETPGQTFELDKPEPRPPLKRRRLTKNTRRGVAGGTTRSSRGRKGVIDRREKA